MTPNTCYVHEWGDWKNVGINNRTDGDVVCGATLIKYEQKGKTVQSPYIRSILIRSQLARKECLEFNWV